MGKGKKKGDKKKEVEPSLSSLSISEPSTSQISSVTAADDEGKKKSKSDQAPDKPKLEAPIPSQPVVSKSTEPEPEKEEESTGLGLTGGRKRNPRKKKKEAAAQLPPAVEAVPAASVATSTPASVSAPQVKASDTAWGQGSVRSAPVQGQRPSPEHAKAPGQQAAQGVPARHGDGRGRGWGRGVQPLPQSTSIPGQAPPGALRQTPPPRQTFVQAPTQSQVPAPMQSQVPGPMQAQVPAPIQSQVPTPMQSQVPIQPKSIATTSRGDSPDVQTTKLCRFVIPAKIHGQTVQARPIRVITNYLPMTIKPLKIYRYDVSFKPDKPKKFLPKAYEMARQKYFPNNKYVAFDQMKNCYTMTPLPNVDQERFVTNVEIVDNNGRKIAYEVSFKFTGIVDLSTILKYMSTGGTSLNPPTEAIQCVDVILRQGTLQSYIKAGRQFFKRPSQPIDLGDGLEMWTGLFQSAIFTSRSFVNIDVAHKGFPRQQPLIQALINDFRLDPNRPLEQQRGRGVESFKMFIKGLRVIANIGGDHTAQAQRREFICNDLVDPPHKLFFTSTDPSTGKEKRLSVADYFTKEKRCRLQYPNLNCMWVGPRDRTIYYPMELLEVGYGQVLNKQLNENQLSTMVRTAASPPDERKRKIEEVIHNMDYSRSAYFKHFGLDISSDFTPVPAKVLRPPMLQVGSGPPIEPRNGSWQSNTLVKPEALKTWGFIAVEPDQRSGCNFENMIDMLMNNGRQMGMAVAAPLLIDFNVRIQDMYKVLFTALKKDVNFLFVVVSTRGRDYYQRVKQVAECEVGILTQCIKENTAARRFNHQTVRNILLKVNSKLMGINQVLHSRSLPKCLESGGVMVVGADVTHPSPDQTSIPSIAAVTASIDPTCFIYNIQLSIQTPKKEMIVEFEDMMVEHLQVYKKRQGVLPKKIYIFRDGVSEGQFAQVMNSEMQAVYDAYARLTGTRQKPEVLFLLVQKRHHTRFFSGPERPRNVDPGTVVDTEIVHARELDFYLVSHQAIKGTARPTRYHAVCNDGGIPSDQVEQLTYYLCHLYSRCMRAVSYPTPTYYAHLACLRARALTYGQKFDNKALEKSPKRLKVMDTMLGFSRMFFV